MSVISDFEKKNINASSVVESIFNKALRNRKVLSDVLEGVSSDVARIKYGCAKVLRLIGEKKPEVLYSKWDFFVDLLDTENTFLKSDAIFIIGHLVRVDSENNIERVFNRLYKLLDDESMITAANLVGVSGIVAKAKPELQARITTRLLSIDETHHGSECKNVLKGHIITVLDAYFNNSKDKKRILDFVRTETRNTRPSTRRKAEDFLKKWE